MRYIAREPAVCHWLEIMTGPRGVSAKKGRRERNERGIKANGCEIGKVLSGSRTGCSWKEGCGRFPWINQPKLHSDAQRSWKVETKEGRVSNLYSLQSANESCFAKFSWIIERAACIQHLLRRWLERFLSYDQRNIPPFVSPNLFKRL